MPPATAATAAAAAARGGYCEECDADFRDIKAHRVTHLKDRPYKCSLPGCEYYTKGFARKYDCQRHTKGHYASPQPGASGADTYDGRDPLKSPMDALSTLAIAASTREDHEVVMERRNTEPSGFSPVNKRPIILDPNEFHAGRKRHRLEPDGGLKSPRQSIDICSNCGTRRRSTTYNRPPNSDRLLCESCLEHYVTYHEDRPLEVEEREYRSHLPGPEATRLGFSEDICRYPIIPILHSPAVTVSSLPSSAFIHPLPSPATTPSIPSSDSTSIPSSVPTTSSLLPSVLEADEDPANSNCSTTRSSDWRRSPATGNKVCQPCYRYFAKHKRERPPNLWRQPRTEPIPPKEEGGYYICSNCSTLKSARWIPKQYGGVLCDACYRYERKYNRARPRGLEYRRLSLISKGGPAGTDKEEEERGMERGGSDDEDDDGPRGDDIENDDDPALLAMDEATRRPSSMIRAEEMDREEESIRRSFLHSPVEEKPRLLGEEALQVRKGINHIVGGAEDPSRARVDESRQDRGRLPQERTESRRSRSRDTESRNGIRPEREKSTSAGPSDFPPAAISRTSAPRSTPRESTPPRSHSSRLATPADSEPSNGESYTSVRELAETLKGDIAQLKNLSAYATLKVVVEKRRTDLEANLEKLGHFVEAEEAILNSNFDGILKKELLAANLDGCMKEGNWRGGVV